MSLIQVIWLYLILIAMENIYSFPNCGEGTFCRSEHAKTTQTSSTPTTHKSTSLSTRHTKVTTKYTTIPTTFSTSTISTDISVTSTQPWTSDPQHYTTSPSVYSSTRKSADRTVSTMSPNSTKHNKQNKSSTKEASSFGTSAGSQQSNTTSAKCFNKGEQMCQCDTSYFKKIEFWKSKNFTTVEMLEFMAPLMKKVIKELTLNKTRLSANIRRRTSAPDSRRSSKQIGVVAITFIVGVVALVIFIDVVSILRFFNILKD